jgi:hypothetical protein
VAALLVAVFFLMIIDEKNYIARLHSGQPVRCDIPRGCEEHREGVRRFINKMGVVKPPVYLMSENFITSLLDAADVISSSFAQGNLSITEPVQFILMTQGVKSHIVEFKPGINGGDGRLIEYNDLGRVESFLEVENGIANGYTVGRSELITVWRFALFTYFFMMYGDVQTVYVCNEKIAVPDFGIVTNKTGLKVITLTSTWLNNIVRETGFKVKGHFRLQSYGPGMTDKKLIWINTFEKKGYNRANDRWKEMPSKN